ncbi:MmgE/PrpD family protein [Dasania marina]|uniref:MmgE/PrpD family protein n=1 Tax=Dasania marina TaxID=471499 RepID=UPI0030DD04E0|tara:strand:+ start:143449 stop:144759 length:1311 start_codon:yes stop_codon:yes gene_type:complete
MTLTQQLISLIRNKPIGNNDLERAAFFTLDAIANALAGRNSEPGKKLLQWGACQGNDAGRKAFVIGGLTHILETDDLHRASVTHPGCVVVPAVFALAEREKSNSVDILKAVLQGFEAMCRVGSAVGPAHYRIWHNTATCGPFGSAMAAASLLALSDEQAMFALGNAGTQSSGLWQFLETGAMSKHLHAGRAAEAGVVAADLALLDFTGPPAILEGEKGFFVATCADAKPESVTAASDAPWQLTTTSIKPWPSCRHTHPAIDAALELHNELAGREIKSVHIDTYQAAMDVCDRPNPDSEYAAKFSIFHCVAAALDAGEVIFDSFSEANRLRLGSLRDRITSVVANPYAEDYPDSWGSAVSVTCTNGDRLVATRTAAKGDPELALSNDEMIAKAKMLLDHGGYSQQQAEKIIEGVLGLAKEHASVEIVNYVCGQLNNN